MFRTGYGMAVRRFVMTATPFGAQHASNYVDGPRRQVPGFDGLHRMMSQLLAETCPADARVLVLGAGGGLEIKTLADDHAGWSFVGVDPSRPMLGIAQDTIAPHGGRVDLIEGYLDSAPDGPFDAATCLLTMHFVPREQRLDTLRGLRRRLKSGAPLVMAHISFAQTEPERSAWIARHVTYGGKDPAQFEKAKEAIATRLTILPPQEEEVLLAEAGFGGITLFYAALSFRGWIAYGN
jgi:tRNA (cmo5U34)-methyltransferase